ncbi:hypothetical protein AB0L80_15845 [Streptomyces sp. NPDC052069]|uniref:hypothetical protein n=1 Tax=Streptomyces sp. NPDC052069 TaxID=3154650 RepID=UPI0034241425
MAELVDSADAHGRADGHGGAFAACPEAGIEYRRARTPHVLQRPGEAVPAFPPSAPHRDPGRHRPYALTRPHLAEALVADGHLEAACTPWHIFLGHYPHAVGSNGADRVPARTLQHRRSFPRQRRGPSS